MQTPHHTRLLLALSLTTLLLTLTPGCQSPPAKPTYHPTTSGPVIPPGWQPPIDWIEDFLQQEIQRNQTDNLQLGILATQQAIAVDARLFQTYVRLWEKLDPASRNQLLRDQTAWLENRANLARERQQTPEGGDPNIAYSFAYADVTFERLQQLMDQLEGPR
ncbi:MAG: hypothetical protein RI897_4240 [Verrucomicrobiota bacterium]|jgi:uncharacterized protein YecT (DUF1311 family)